MNDHKKTDALNHDHRRARRPNTTLSFQRSKNGLIAGIAGGIAQYIQANPFYLRIAFIGILIVSLGIAGLAYVILWWLIPLEP